MRSLYLKLSLAFVFVSLTAVVLVSLFVRLQTREQFDQFMLDRNQSEVMNELVSYYEENGSWANVRAILMKDGPPARPDEHRRREFWLPVTLVGLNNRVIVEGGNYEHGQFLSEEDLRTAVAVTVNDETVGFVLFPNTPN
ncbi:MAG: hypothetical protein KDD89_11545, partial [Anaerolineales bacterium]|nr:hypothetical protein [Anaerolineales bacterium]